MSNKEKVAKKNEKKELGKVISGKLTDVLTAYKETVGAKKFGDNIKKLTKIFTIEVEKAAKKQEKKKKKLTKVA